MQSTLRKLDPRKRNSVVNPERFRPLALDLASSFGRDPLGGCAHHLRVCLTVTSELFAIRSRRKKKDTACPLFDKSELAVTVYPITRLGKLDQVASA